MIKANEVRRTAEIRLAEKRRELMQTIERGIQKAADEGYFYYSIQEPMLTSTMWQIIDDELIDAGFDVRRNNGILTIMWAEDDDEQGEDD